MVISFVVVLIMCIILLIFPLICVEAIIRHEDKVRKEKIVERTGFIKLLTTLHLYNLFSSSWED